MDLHLVLVVLSDSLLSLVLLGLFLYVSRVAPNVWGVRLWAFAQAAATVGADLMDLSASAQALAAPRASVDLLVHVGACLGVSGAMGCAIAVAKFARQSPMLKSERLALGLVLLTLASVLLVFESNRNDWTMYLVFQLLCLVSMVPRLLRVRSRPYRPPALLMVAGCGVLAVLDLSELSYTWSAEPANWQALNVALMHQDIAIWFLLNFSMLLMASMKATAMQRELADIDPLTGALNRRGIDSRMQRDACAGPESRTLSVLMLDLDHFKSINDRHGHDTGDQVLQGSAEVVRSCIRPDDFFVRLGGEEFAVLTYAAEPAVLLMGERIRRSIEAGRLASQTELRVTTSVGVAIGLAGVGYRELITLADQAVYRAKHAGRNRMEVSRWEPGCLAGREAPCAGTRPTLVQGTA